MELDESGWEPLDGPVEPPPGVSASAPVDAPAAPPARVPPPAQPQGTRQMYEPDELPRDQQVSPQWEPYDSTTHIPPLNDVRPPPGWAPRPPPGRQYGMYRQEPTWQHASIAGPGMGGLDLSTGNVLVEVLRGIFALGAGAAVGYVLTGEARAAGAGALAVMGAVQVPSMFGQGGLVRAMIAAASLGGAYLLARPYSPMLRGKGAGYDEVDDSSNDDGPDVFEPNGDEQDEPEEDDDEPVESTARTCSFRSSEPATKSPWLKQVKRTL